LRGRPWSWITGRPRLTDGLLVGFSLLTGAGGVAGIYARTSSISVVVIAAVLLQSVPLWWRRSHPVTVLQVLVAVVVVRLLLGLGVDTAGAPLVFAVYAVSAYGPSPYRLWVAGVCIALIVSGVAAVVFNQVTAVRDQLSVGAPAFVAWVIGDYMRSRRQFLVDMLDRHRKEREHAAEEERLRIARELHDVVAHNVSLMAIQAGAARVSGASSPAALQSIETTARDTLAELNRLLGVLRKDPDGAARAPQPGLAQVDTLVQPARQAGLDVSVKVSGEQRPLPAALDLSAYRIVQEAITNVLKHAHASRVEVGIDYGPDALVLSISDNGNGADAAPAASSGHGLIGMRERVDLFGGDLNTASSSLGGFTVRATLPVKT
jgi:signal transduction histidine kinase